MIESGKVNLSFVIFSMSMCLILSTAAKFLSLSISCVFKEDNSGQRKMLIPEGKSGVSQRKSQFQRQEVNDDDGWNAMFSMCKRCINNSLALNWVFLWRKALKNSTGSDACFSKGGVAEAFKISCFLWTSNRLNPGSFSSFSFDVF